MQKSSKTLQNTNTNPLWITIQCCEKILHVVCFQHISTNIRSIETLDMLILITFYD